MIESPPQSPTRRNWSSDKTVFVTRGLHNGKYSLVCLVAHNWTALCCSAIAPCYIESDTTCALCWGCKVCVCCASVHACKDQTPPIPSQFQETYSQWKVCTQLTSCGSEEIRISNRLNWWSHSCVMCQSSRETATIHWKPQAPTLHPLLPGWVTVWVGNTCSVSWSHRYSKCCI